MDEYQKTINICNELTKIKLKIPDSTSSYINSLLDSSHENIKPPIKKIKSNASKLDTIVKELKVADKSPVKYNKVQNKKVFIVHGHDNSLRDTVANFLESKNLEPIVLCKQPSNGCTVIEKIEENDDVGYAVILYSPCDVGKSKKQQELTQRARQNVVFEHGYFTARLGRRNICVINNSNDIEFPGDVLNLVRIFYDSNSKDWENDLSRELKSVGLLD